MKKSLLAVLSFLTISVSAQTEWIDKVATFDFHTLTGDTILDSNGEIIYNVFGVPMDTIRLDDNKKIVRDDAGNPVRDVLRGRVENIRTVNLTPTVYFGEENVWPADGHDFSFVDNGITFSSKKGASAYYVLLNQNISPYWPGLQLGSKTSFIITAPEGYSLDSMDVSYMNFYDGTSHILPDDNTNFGTSYYGFWRAISGGSENPTTIKGISTMTFVNKSMFSAVLSGIKVYYSSPTDVLEYSTIAPAIDEETDPFTGYVLTFAEDITVAENAEFVVKDSDEAVVATLVAKAEGKTLTLTPEAPITKPGTYTLYVSAGAIRHKVTKNQEEYNKAFTATFSVKDHPNTFLYSDITTAEGKVKTLPQQIVMTFPSAIGSTTLETIDLMNDETVAKTATVSIDSEDATKLVLQFDADITEEGTYTLTFPENSIKAADEFHYNKAFTLTYNVVNYDVPSAELVAKADSLLALTGVGYPKTNATARTTLVAVAAAEDSDVKAYTDAIAAYIATDDVMLPHYNKYYTISKVASPDADTKNYIGYADEALVSTTAEADAHHFLFVDVEGDRCIQLADGKQMKIQLAKTVDAENPEKVFGLMDVTIEGFTDESEGAGYVLNQVFSPEPDYTVVLSPADEQLDVLTEITVTIPEATTIKYNKTLPVQMLVKKDEQFINADEIIKSVKAAGNVLTIKIELKENGVYQLDIPEGAITFYSIDHDVTVKAITATYDISRRYGLQYDLTSVYSVYNTLNTDVPHKSAEMNNVGFYCIDTELFINPDKCVAYLQTELGRNLFTGTLIKSNTVWGNENRSTLSFDFGTEFNETNLPDGTYVFGVEMGCFGDSNYGEYLANPTSANKAKSHVNHVLSFTYEVSNTETGINDLRNNDAATEIYDISGRRVAVPAKAGLYIIGGKKVIVK